MAEIGKDISKAIQLLESGELVAIPTETVYGLAGNALNPSAVTRIFVTKDRPHFDPLIVHVSSLEKAKTLVHDFPEKALALAQHYWPGPLTLLLERNPIIPDLVTSGLDTVGIRCPRHPLAIELLKRLPFPLAAPSANPFGYISPTRPEHVNEQLGDKIAYILDGGPCPIGIESTIVGFEKNNVLVHRHGAISLEALEKTVGKVNMYTQAEKVLAPGQLMSHYAPRKQLIIGNIAELLKGHPNNNIGILSFQKRFPDVDNNNQIVLSPAGSLEEAAQHLFSALRQLDKMDISMILTEEFPDTGIGRAINDRLHKAAAKK